MPAVSKVHALLAGELSVPAALNVVGSSGVYPLPLMLFALETDAGLYLVDAGTEDPFAGPSLPWRVLGRVPFAKAATRRATRFRSVEQLLADLGKTRDDVKGVLLTHLDYDHTGALPWLAGVPVWVSRRELHHARRVVRGLLANLFQPRALVASATGRYVRRHLESIATVHEITPAAGAGYGPFSRTHDVFGDGSIVAVDLPGHTPGHLGFVIRTADGREIFLAGDAPFSSDLLQEGATPGALPRLFAQDWETAKRTLTLLRRLRRDRPDLTIVPSHCAQYGALARNGPAAL